VTRPGAVLVVVFAAACHPGAGRTRPAADAVAWTEVATEYGEISIPVGWHVRARRSPDPIFDLYAQDPGLQVLVVTVQRQAAEVTMQEAQARQLRDVGAPATLTLTEQPEGWRYGAAVRGDGRVFAACGVGYGADVAVLAVAGVVEGHAVPQRSFEAEGGRAMLCGIAASARRLAIAVR
jgi:hypothetical protein